MSSEVPGKQKIFNEKQFSYKGVLFYFQTKGLRIMKSIELGCNQHILKTEKIKRKVDYT